MPKAAPRETRRNSLRPPNSAPGKSLIGRKRQRSDSTESSDIVEDLPGRKLLKTADGARRAISASPLPSTRGKAKALNGNSTLHAIQEALGRPIVPLKGEINPVPHPPVRVRPSRTLWLFGNGDMGQFGLGTAGLGEVSRPQIHGWFEQTRQTHALGLNEGAGIEKLAVGGMHNLAIDEVGKVWTWGINDNYALGRKTDKVVDPNNPGQYIPVEELETMPVVLQDLADQGFRAVDIAAGASHSIAIGHDGTLRAWGTFSSAGGILGFDENATPESPNKQLHPTVLKSLARHRFSQVVCGHDHIVALTTTGKVFAWGNGQQAQLGRRIVERHKHAALKPAVMAKLRNIVRVYSGHYHSFAIDKSGKVYAWGLNNYGQTGVTPSDFEKGEQQEEDMSCIWTPTLVSALGPSAFGGRRRVVDIAGGEHHSLFLLSDGSVWACGRADGFELGIGQDHPEWRRLQKRIAEAKVEILEEQRAARRKSRHEKPGVDAMDEDDEGGTDMGNGEGGKKKIVVDEYIPYPVPLLFPPPPNPNDDDPPLEAYTPLVSQSAVAQGIKQVACGLHFSLALGEGGHVYSWGYGPSCELGRGDDRPSAVPGRVWSEELDAREVVLDDGSVERGKWNVEGVHAGGQHCLLVVRWEPEG